jgi:hypothetical protein
MQEWSTFYGVGAKFKLWTHLFFAASIHFLDYSLHMYNGEIVTA